MQAQIWTLLIVVFPRVSNTHMYKIWAKDEHKVLKCAKDHTLKPRNATERQTIASGTHDKWAVKQNLVLLISNVWTENKHIRLWFMLNVYASKIKRKAEQQQQQRRRRQKKTVWKIKINSLVKNFVDIFMCRPNLKRCKRTIHARLMCERYNRKNIHRATNIHRSRIYDTHEIRFASLLSLFSSHCALDAEVSSRRNEPMPLSLCINALRMRTLLMVYFTIP